MHLLDVRTRKLKYFAGEVPSYAILSHTWGDDEISFQDIKNAGVEQRAGYLKIKKTCELAAGLQLNYIWVDTCCIDKSSSTELSEAINSMYQWYQDATVCYAYLSDVDINVSSRRESDDQVSNSRYFTRGWTLQEILAPWTVIFLDMHWREMGTRETLRNTLTAITRIPAKFLSGEDLGKASIAQRMSWASHRTTTRFEDRAYSLLGIFGLSMPLLYGEGQKAFIRLQEEIINNIDDYSIFAWTLPGTGSADVLSPSPEGFHYSRGIIP
ncbi:heterokaryon incompatibility protein-domain-containing protein, partial [Exophiala viscosa]